MPLVTVVIPVYNAMPYLKDALGSILAQTLQDVSVLVLDDASTDGSSEYLDGLRDSRLSVQHCTKQGLVSLLNMGMGLATSKYLACMHADDISLPRRLEKQVEVMEKDPGIVACGCQITLIDSEGRPTGTWPYGTCDAVVRYDLLSRCPLSHPGAMVRLDDLLAVGGYQHAMFPAEDYDLWTRLAERGRLTNTEEMLLHYRIHDTNVSVQRREDMHQRVGHIAIRQLMRSGFARSEAEAERLFHLKRRVHSDGAMELTVEEGHEYLGFFESYVRQYEGRYPAFAGDLSHVRRMLRWLFLNRAEGCKAQWRKRLQWLLLARKADPAEMRLPRIISRVLKNKLAARQARPPEPTAPAARPALPGVPR
jgi:glycosyltransferase involved in cell wall biosynthesis